RNTVSARACLRVRKREIRYGLRPSLLSLLRHESIQETEVRSPKTSNSLHLSTVANSKFGNTPWLNIESAGWLNIQSALTGNPCGAFQAPSNTNPRRTPTSTWV
ncbi:hypothetical protein, partial [Rhodoferax sp.]|uniref:hypothetical protein n=1 Tax=Rhodoferax sp. TaxID=50421 RepID=UPI002622C46F